MIERGRKDLERRLKEATVMRVGKKEYLTTEGMAHVLGISTRTWRRYRHDKEEAFSILHSCTQNPARESLEQLVQFTIEREN